jgi:hypothetical protein
MTKYTADYLNSLLEQHTEGDIRATALDLKAHLADLEQETNPEKKAALTETVRDLATLLEHELRENGRGGEDYVNDGVFHARE